MAEIANVEWVIYGSLRANPGQSIDHPESLLSILRRDELRTRAVGEFEQAVALQAYADRLEQRLLLPDDCEWADRGAMSEEELHG